MTGLRTTTLAVSVAVLGVAPAAAAPLGPLSGSAGCVAQANSGSNLTKNCAVSKGLDGANALAITPDGSFVYASAGIQSNSDDPGYGAVSVLKRDPNTGGLTEVACISSDGTDGRDSVVGQCDANAGLLNADAIAVSPDAKNVYAATYDSGSVVGFARDPSSGKLTELACFQENVPAGSPCYTGRVFRGSDGIAVSPDNSSLYVGSSRRDAISELLASDASSGGAPATSAASVFETPPPNNFLADPCIATAGLDGACDRGAAMRGINSLVVSPDGRNVYASATRSGAIAVFTRDSSGKLTQTGCLMHNAPDGLCGHAKLLSAPGHLAISADGRNLYVVDSSTLVILRRDPTAGSLSEVGCIDDLPEPSSGSGSSGSGSGSASSAGRVRHAASDPCQQVPGLNAISAVAIGPDDATV